MSDTEITRGSKKYYEQYRAAADAVDFYLGKGWRKFDGQPDLLKKIVGIIATEFEKYPDMATRDRVGVLAKNAITGGHASYLAKELVGILLHIEKTENAKNAHDPELVRLYASDKVADTALTVALNAIAKAQSRLYPSKPKSLHKQIELLMENPAHAMLKLDVDTGYARELLRAQQLLATIVEVRPDKTNPVMLVALQKNLLCSRDYTLRAEAVHVLNMMIDHKGPALFDTTPSAMKTIRGATRRLEKLAIKPAHV